MLVFTFHPVVFCFSFLVCKGICTVTWLTAESCDSPYVLLEVSVPSANLC